MTQKPSRPQTKWDKLNLILAIILLMLVFATSGKLIYNWWINDSVQSDKTVVINKLSQKKTKQKSLDLSEISIDQISYQTATDFLHLPTLVVHYRMKNNSDTGALPMYVFNQKIRFHQLTTYNTTTILAGSDLATGRLRGVSANYLENQEIMLLPNQTVTVIQTYRLESMKRPVTMQVLANGHTQKINPWQLSMVKANE
ncbi:DUF5067 domain-containing protein [Pediococcus ethanolidurans]|nr:DUF5067 domain-containing protein [Pediococcus ethanolidurans]GEN94185.1 hypothetical protein PET01_02350 [Pediococcus ethanolidurans]SER07972.1 protein of unknown function [Pediococcus ethanolidurans]